MPGGAGSRNFFSNQVHEYSNRLVDELPETKYTADEEEAGFKRLSETFGFYASLDNIARYVGQTDQEVLKWSVNEYYTKLKLLSWRADAQRKYQDIMKNKK